MAFCAVAVALAGCSGTDSTESVPPGVKGRAEPPRGFFDRLADNFGERQCNVVRFICPYGLGPAGEPCECTDPRGVVLRGRTVK